MLIYIFDIMITVFMSIILVEFEKKKVEKKFIYLMRFLIILIPSILAGLRYGIGTDYLKVYEPIFENAKLGIYENRHRTIEIGYIIINKIVIMLNGNFSMVMFLSSLITNTFFILGIYQYKDKICVPVAIGIYLLMYYQVSYNAVRQFMAIAIIFWGLKFLKYENIDIKSKSFRIDNSKYLVCVVIAFLFHKSALIALSIPFLKLLFTQEKYKYAKIFFFVIVFLLIINCNNIGKILKSIPFLKYYGNYLLSPKKIKVSIWYFVKTLPVILPALALKNEMKKDKNIQFIFGNMLLGMLLMLLTYFTHSFGERIALYFEVMQIIIVPYYIKAFNNFNIEPLKLKGKHYMIIITIIYTIFYTAYWYHSFIHKNMNETMPYYSIFEREKFEEDNHKNKFITRREK